MLKKKFNSYKSLQEKHLRSFWSKMLEKGKLFEVQFEIRLLRNDKGSLLCSFSNKMKSLLLLVFWNLISIQMRRRSFLQQEITLGFLITVGLTVFRSFNRMIKPYF
jgi:hypothetical protein